MSVLTGLGRLHDFVTRMGAIAAALCLGAIGLLYFSEVLSRYFLHAPTSWTAAVSIYLMLVVTMLMLPFLTMKNDHVTVSMNEYLPGPVARGLTVAAIAAATIVCLVSTYITYEEMARAFMRGTRTTDTLFIPKWWLMAFIVYGLASTTIHFARQFWTSIATRPAEETARA